MATSKKDLLARYGDGGAVVSGKGQKKKKKGRMERKGQGNVVLIDNDAVEPQAAKKRRTQQSDEDDLLALETAEKDRDEAVLEAMDPEDEELLRRTLAEKRVQQRWQTEEGRPSSSSPLARRRHDSPPPSPPRRRHDSPDASPPRRKVTDLEVGASSPRRRHDSPDASPPRRKSAIVERKEEKDASPPRRSRQAKEDEEERPAVVVVTDRRGRKLEMLSELQSGGGGGPESQFEWGGGTKEDKKVTEQVPSTFTVAIDDPEREARLRGAARWGDPMASMVKKKSSTSSKRDKDKKSTPLQAPLEYTGPGIIPNRFGIKPGAAWDGRDRSNGFESRWFKHKNAAKIRTEERTAWEMNDL